MSNKILVIEDESHVRENIGYILAEEGYDVLYAVSGEEAIKLIEKEAPDLVLSDINLPGISGYELLETIQKSKKLNNAPFIFLTAMTEMSNLRKGMNLGADDYLIKPFKMKELLATVKMRLAKHEAYQKQNIEKAALEGQFFINGVNGYVSLTVSEIVFIEAEGVYTTIATADGKKILCRKLLKEWEEMLPGKDFIRIHKSYMINLNYIAKIEKWMNNSYSILMKPFDKPLISSRRYSAELRKKIII